MRWQAEGRKTILAMIHNGISISSLSSLWRDNFLESCPSQAINLSWEQLASGDLNIKHVHDEVENWGFLFYFDLPPTQRKNHLSHGARPWTLYWYARAALHSLLNFMNVTVRLKWEKKKTLESLFERTISIPKKKSVGYLIFILWTSDNVRK